jgi:hypothetical protein
MILGLLDSMKNVAGLDRIRPQIIVGDNNSEDGTWELLQRTAENFPLPIKLSKVKRPGKSAVLNDAVRAADGRISFFSMLMPVRVKRRANSMSSEGRIYNYLGMLEAKWNGQADKQ